MSALYLITIVATIAGQNVMKKMYTRKAAGNGVFLFSACTVFFSMTFFVVTLGGAFKFDAGIIPYVIAFALTYAAATIFGILAISTGPLSLSALMNSYSLLIPTFYGVFYLKEPIKTTFVIGLIILAVSLFLVNKKNDKMRITPKWLLFAVLALLSNGACSTVQKMQQAAFFGEYRNEFMILSLAIVTVVFAALTLTVDKGSIKTNLYNARFSSVGCGVMNGLANMLVMVVSGMIPVSIMFPLVSAGGIIVTYLISRFIYKEKLSKIQFIGFLMGIASVVFLNLNI